MYEVYMYIEIRRACLVDGLSIRNAARKYGINRRTVKKMLNNAIPLEYSRQKIIELPVIGGYKEFIEEILVDGLIYKNTKNKFDFIRYISTKKQKEVITELFTEFYIIDRTENKYNTQGETILYWAYYNEMYDIVNKIRDLSK